MSKAVTYTFLAGFLLMFCSLPVVAITREPLLVPVILLAGFVTVVGGAILEDVLILRERKRA